MTRVRWVCACLAFFCMAGANAQDPTGGQSTPDELTELRRRIEQLEQRLSDTGGEVDLSDQRAAAVDPQQSQHVLARPWYENVHISGFAALDYLATGNAALRPNGGFAVRETSLWIEADVWEDVTVFFEIRTDYKAFNNFAVTSGEVYGHFRNLFGQEGLGVKVGRFDVPFSEEYLVEHPPDNPLILNSAHWWYGTDEGVLLYGKIGGMGWVTSVTDGSISRNVDDSSEKAFTLKAYGNPTEELYLSASAFRNGKTSRGALRFGGSDFEPVGQGGPSTVGSSASSEVDAWAYALDARLAFGHDDHVLVSFGQAWVDDADSAFDREFLWWSAEAKHHVSDTLYLAARYSSIGTYDSNEGYHFDGTFTAGGNLALGYDTREMQRLQVGLGWHPVPHVLLKVEGGYDRYRLIDGSPLDPDNDERWFFGTELVLSF